MCLPFFSSSPSQVLEGSGGIFLCYAIILLALSTVSVTISSYLHLAWGGGVCAQLPGQRGTDHRTWAASPGPEWLEISQQFLLFPTLSPHPVVWTNYQYQDDTAVTLGNLCDSDHRWHK